MKNFLLLFLSVISLYAQADQSELLSKGRDLLIDQAASVVKGYCQDYLAVRSADATYICRLQIEADCAQTSKKQKHACLVLARVQELEKNVVLSDKNLAQLGPTPLYSSRPKLPESAVPVSVALTYTQIKVFRGSAAEHAPKTPEALSDSETLDKLATKINSTKVRTDCASDAECRIQDFGKSICGGPMGTIVYSTRGGKDSLLEEEILAFNKKDEAFIKNWNRNVLGTCDSKGRTDPARCTENKCY